jgi:hypothetical protein
MAKNTVFRVYEDEETMLKVYQRRLKMADVDYDKREPEYKRFLARYQNEKTEEQVTEDGTIVNVSQGIGTIDTMFSSLTAVDVEFILRRKGKATAEQILAAEQGLNQAMDDTKMQRRAKKAIKDALIVDIGWVKVYYDYVTDVDVADRPEMAVQAEVAELMGSDPSLSQEAVEKMVSMTEEVEIVLRDRVCVDYVPWTDIRYDVGAKQIEDARWTAQYTKMPAEEVRFNPTWREFVLDRYGKTEGKRLLDDLEGDANVTAGMDYADVEGLSADEHGDDDLRVTVIEMWDLETGLVTTFPKSRTDLVLYQRPNPLMFNMDLEDRNPFKPLIIRDDPDNLEGLGDMRVIMPSLEELDHYRTNIARHIERSIPKIFGPKDALGQQGRKALTNDEWMAFVGLEGGHSYQEFGQPTIPAVQAEVYDLQERIQAEIEETTGQNEITRGVFPSKRTTATEAQLVTTGGQARQGERRSCVEEWYTDIAGTALQLMQLFYDRDRMATYISDAGDKFEWSWTKEDIAIEADIEVALTPKENLTREERFQRAIFVANMVLPMPEADRAEILRWVFREAGLDAEDTQKMVRTQEETAAQQMAETAAPNVFAEGQQKNVAYGSMYGGGPKRG